MNFKYKDIDFEFINEELDAPINIDSLSIHVQTGRIIARPTSNLAREQIMGWMQEIARSQVNYGGNLYLMRDHWNWFMDNITINNINYSDCWPKSYSIKSGNSDFEIVFFFTDRKEV